MKEKIINISENLQINISYKKNGVRNSILIFKKNSKDEIILNNFLIDELKNGFKIFEKEKKKDDISTKEKTLVSDEKFPKLGRQMNW